MQSEQVFGEGKRLVEIENIAERLYISAKVIKHQQHAGERQHYEQIEGNPTHAPGVAIAHCITIDFGGMQMQEDVGEHAQSTVARCVVVLVTENRGVDLGLGGLAQDLDLLFCLCRQVRL